MNSGQKRMETWLLYRQFRERLLSIPGVVAVGTNSERSSRAPKSGHPVSTSHSGILLSVRDPDDVAQVMKKAIKLLGDSIDVTVELARPDLGIGLAS